MVASLIEMVRQLAVLISGAEHSLREIDKMKRISAETLDLRQMIADKN
jgi:hypothetical protein